MPVIPENYPDELNDSELINLVRKCSVQATRAARPNSNIVTGVSYWKEMAELGQNEINLRIQKEFISEMNLLKKEIINFKEENRKSSKVNKRLNYITVILAILTLLLGFIHFFNMLIR